MTVTPIFYVQFLLQTDSMIMIQDYPEIGSGTDTFQRIEPNSAAAVHENEADKY